jgi:hypothetical protein
MKKTLLIIIFLFSIQVFSQDFKGIIKYETSFEKLVENNAINIEDLKAFLGINSTFITKNGSYKQISEGKFMSFQLYKPNQSKLYYKDLIEADTLYFKDVKKHDNTKFEYEIIKNADTILGYVCHKLIYKTKDSESHYYFAPELKQNPKYFKNYKFENKDKLVELTKSIYLRYDLFFNGLKIKSTATSIERKKIKDNEFEIPKNQIIVEK